MNFAPSPSWKRGSPERITRVQHMNMLRDADFQEKSLYQKNTGDEKENSRGKQENETWGGGWENRPPSR